MSGNNDKTSGSTRNYAKQPKRSGYVSAASDKDRFRKLQDRSLKKIAQAGRVEVNSKDLYTHRLSFGKQERKEIISHCYDTDELKAAEKLPKILPTLKDGKYLPVDPSRKNYKSKMAKGVRHYVKYTVMVNGVEYELKSSVMRDIGNHKRVKEFPYSLKKKG